MTFPKNGALVLLVLVGTVLGCALADDNFALNTRDSDCSISGVSDQIWDTRLTLRISDNQRGIIFRSVTNNIFRVRNATYVGCDLTGTDYILAQIIDDEFYLELVDSKWADYEINESSPSLTFVVTFDCFAGFRSLTVTVEITDTNNHSPQFLPTNEYVFAVRLPLLNGYPISNVYGNIVVRDDDLTTYGVFPTIQPNEYFDLAFIERNFTKRYYQLSLVAKRTIITFPENITLFMTVLDLDRTGYPSLITIGSITVMANGTDLRQTQPRFGNPIYQGLYDNEDNSFVMDTNITLTRGFNNIVTFELDGEGSDYFTISNVGNVVFVTPGETNIPEDVVLSPEPFVISVIARKGDDFATTALLVNMVTEPNCRFREFNQTIWEEGMALTIEDTMDNDSIRTQTDNVARVISAVDEPGLNNPPYFVPTLYADRLDFEFYNGKFKNTYEQNETAMAFTTRVLLKCSRGERVLPVTHTIIDTNNHDPQLISTKTYEIFTPIPSNFSISRYFGDVVIRDIDLTTYGIEAEVTPNDFVRIEFVRRSNDPKNYIFSLITAKSVLSLNETVTVTLNFRDLDLTGDAQRSVMETITFKPVEVGGDDYNEFPFENML